MPRRLHDTLSTIERQNQESTARAGDLDPPSVSATDGVKVDHEIRRINASLPTIADCRSQIGLGSPAKFDAVFMRFEPGVPAARRMLRRGTTTSYYEGFVFEGFVIPARMSKSALTDRRLGSTCPCQSEGNGRLPCTQSRYRTHQRRPPLSEASLPSSQVRSPAGP
jgi:hypothetical protein